MVFKKKKQDISLLPDEERKLSFDSLSEWLLSVGRWIIVCVQLIVVLAFLSRFWLDQRIAELYETTEQKKMMVEAAAEFEQDFRLLRQQTQLAQSIIDNNQNQKEVLEKIVALLPEKVYLTNLKAQQNQISFTIISKNETMIKDFFQKLLTAPYLEEVSIASLSTKMFGLQTELAIDVTLPSTAQNE